MREVTIPNDYNPFRLEVNGRIYSYTAGTTQSVPDEVAALIEKYNRSKPVPRPNSVIDNLGLAYSHTDAGTSLHVTEDGKSVEWKMELGEEVLIEIEAAKQDAQDAKDAAVDAKDAALEAKEQAENAVETIEAIEESIPQDYTALSAAVDDLMSLGLSVVNGAINITFKVEE